MAGKKGVDDEKRRKKGDGGLERDAGYATGYETDGASTSGKPRTKLKKKSKTRKTSGDTGYETDDGYMSSAPKSKSRFFKLGNKSKPDLDEQMRPQVEIPPPPPPLPVFRLPIAEKFARTLGDINAGATMVPPLGPLGAPNAPSAVVSPSSFSIPSSVLGPMLNDADKESADTLEPSEATTFKRNAAVRFASGDSSDHNGTASTGSIAGHSFFSKMTPSSSSSSPISTSPPKPKMVISLPITRSPSPPSPPAIQPVVIPNLNKSSTKRVPGPLFLHRVPSDQGKLLGSYSNSGNASPSEWSPAGSPFVVITPNPATSSPTVSGRPGFLRSGTASNGNSSETVTRPRPSPSPLTIPEISRSRSPADDILPSSDYIVPSPRPSSPFSPPNALAHYDLPPPSPPPTGPLPRPPNTSQSQPDLVGSSRQRPNLAPPTNSPLRSVSPGGTPRRGRESPFPTRPVLPNSTSANISRSGNGFESRVRVKRYRDLYATPSGGWDNDSSDSHRENSDHYGSEFSVQQQRGAQFRRHATQASGNVGINVEEPSDDEGYGGEGYGYDDASDEEIRNVLSRFRSGSASGHVRGSDNEGELEAALDRRRSLQALTDNFLDPTYSPRGRAYGRGQKGPDSRQRSASPSASEGEYSESDDKSRYPDDAMTAGRTTMYRFDNGSRGGTSRRSLDLESLSDGRSRASFLDADKSEQARVRFMKTVEAMYDENGREITGTSQVRHGRGAVAAIPPVPKLPKAIAQPKAWL